MGHRDSARALRVVQRGACTYRETGDDFFCLRYGVWYSSIDCAVRTKHRTAQGCTHCEQGRFNLKRHARALHDSRWNLPAASD